MVYNEADRKTNSEDPDQTAPQSMLLGLIFYANVCVEWGSELIFHCTLWYTRPDFI